MRQLPSGWNVGCCAECVKRNSGTVAGCPLMWATSNLGCIRSGGSDARHTGPSRSRSPTAKCLRELSRTRGESLEFWRNESYARSALCLWQHGSARLRQAKKKVHSILCNRSNMAISTSTAHCGRIPRGCATVYPPWLDGRQCGEGHKPLEMVRDCPRTK